MIGIVTGVLGAGIPLPGLDRRLPSVQTWPVDEDAMRSAEPLAVPFLPTAEAARSQIAEALAGHLGTQLVIPVGTGSHRKPLYRQALRTLVDPRIDIAGARVNLLEELTATRFGHVSTLCDRMREMRIRHLLPSAVSRLARTRAEAA